LPALAHRLHRRVSPRKHRGYRRLVRRASWGRPFYNYHRDYDPQVGRYVESDPIGLIGGINTYSYAASDTVLLADPTGLRIDWGNWVFTNPQVLANFDKLNSAIIASGIADDCFTLRVTGGDRFKDPSNPQVHRSATPPYGAVTNSDPHSPHLIERGARAIDFVIENTGKPCQCRPVTDNLIDSLLPNTDFSPANTRRNYPSGPHTHLNLPPLQKFNAPTWE
jgi:RHS repeat-associated protein